MAVKQIAIFVENQAGSLAEITQLLADAGIDIRAMSISETTDFGILRLIVDNIDTARAVLAEGGFVCSVNEVVAAELPDVPGGIAGVISVLSKNGVNIEYLYAFVGVSGKHAWVVLRVADNEKAEAILTANGYRALSDEQLSGI